MSDPLDTRLDVKRNELRSQILHLLTQNPSIAALLRARDILNASITTFVVLKELTPHICRLLSLRDLLSWCQVCKETRNWLGRVVRNQITSLFRRFVPTPHDLLEIMRKTHSIISGSSIVWLLDGFPGGWSPGDLDVYCPPGEGPKLIEFFRAQGYSAVDPSDVDEEDDLSSFFENAKLSSATVMKNGELKVDVLETATNSTVDSILWYHSTAVMNYISWNEIAVLYPSLTLNKLAIVQDETKQRGDEWVEKYERRSYAVYYPSEVPDSIWDYCPGILRTNRDKASLIVQFDDDESDLPPLLESWRFAGGTREHAQCTQYMCFSRYFHRYPSLRRTLAYQPNLVYENHDDLMEAANEIPGFFKPD